MHTAGFDPSTFAILVVDDEDMNRDMLSRRLERKGYFTLTASGGEEALATIAGTGCDLVMLDVMMPGFSGIDTLIAIRQLRGPAELPVIMASARTDSDAITSCLTAGANDYVTKPLDFAIVYARLQTQLMMKGAVDALRASEARFRQIAELSADLISQHAPDGRFRFASPASRELLGFEPDELVGQKLWDLVHPDDRRSMPASPADLPEACTMVVRLRRKDGRFLWVELRSRSLRGSRTGKVTDIQCSTRDVSFYVDAWTGLPLNRAPLPFASSDDGARIVAHHDHVVAIEADPPVRGKRR